MAKKGVRFKELMGRLTGISTSVFGVSWNPSKPEVTVVREVLTFLEDRRVLYSPTEMETPEHCVASVMEIRRALTQKITEAAEKSLLAEHLRAMRAACHKFLATVEADDRLAVRFGFEKGNYQSWVFLGALGELRGVFGVHVAAVAAMHGLDVEEGLASILPATVD
jgi:hypothetical protein